MAAHSYCTGGVQGEADVVAVGFRDLFEPTPIDIVNNMDHICISSNYMVGGSVTAFTSVDFNHDGKADRDVYTHGLNNVYLAFNGYYASSSNYIAKIASIPSGSYGRLFVLANYNTETTHNFIVSGFATLAIEDPINDICNMYLTLWGFYTDALEENDDESYPEMIVERNLKNWWAPSYENLRYPNGTV